MRKNKLKWAAFGLALGIIGGGIGNAAADKWYPGVTRFETIQAREIVISNKAGEIVAMLAPTPAGDGSVLYFRNSTDRPVASIGAHPDGGRLLIYNKAGDLVAVIGAHPDGDGGPDIRNNAGKQIATLL